MPIPSPHPGLVVCYSYLWQAEYDAGREEGVKDRPCAVVLAAQNEDGDTLVTVVPITHTPPDTDDAAFELPWTTKKRLGLDSERSWVIVAEVNRFVWPGPDLRSVSRDQSDRFDYGVLPPSLFKEIKKRLAECAAAQKLRIVGRTG